jgi:hypothetical protein
MLAVMETIGACEINFATAVERATLGTDQDITEIQFEIFFYTHASSAKYRLSSLSVGWTV